MLSNIPMPPITGVGNILFELSLKLQQPQGFRLERFQGGQENFPDFETARFR